MTTKTDISKITFTSKAFPTADDMALWDSLSPDEKLAVIERDEEAGFQSGVVELETLEQRFQRVLAKMPVNAV